MEIKELVQSVLQMVIYVIITGCGVFVVREFIKFINGKIDEVQTQTKLAEYEKVNKIIDGAQKVLENVVLSVNQVFVDTLKSEGKFDKESATNAKKQAVDKANELLTDEAVKAIEKVYGSVDAYLDVNIEAVVNKIKNNK